MAKKKIPNQSPKKIAKTIRRPRYGTVTIPDVDLMHRTLEGLAARAAMCLDAMKESEITVDMDGIQLSERATTAAMQWVANLEVAVRNATFLKQPK